MTTNFYNYRTDKHDLPSEPTDETIQDYLPQNPATMSLYRLYREHGRLSVMEAMENILLATLGEAPRYKAAFDLSVEDVNVKLAEASRLEERRANILEVFAE